MASITLTRTALDGYRHYVGLQSNAPPRDGALARAAQKLAAFVRREAPTERRCLATGRSENATSAQDAAEGRPNWTT